MGNSITFNFSLDHEGSEKEAIVAGNTLTGNVIVIVNHELEQRNITLFLCGSEQAVVDGKKKPLVAVRFIFSTFVALHRGGEGKIEPGIYDFPFSVDLPASLPSSTELKAPDGGSGGCKIEYKMYIDDGNQYNDKNKVAESMAERGFLVASTPLPIEEMPVLVKPAIYKVKAMNMIKSGSILFAASIENAHVGRQDKLCISLACRNDSPITIQKVNVRVVERYHWQVEEIRSSKKDYERILIEQKDVTLPSLVTKRTRLLSKSQQVDNFVRYETILKELMAHENEIKLEVPNDARDSYKGSLMSISHSIEVSLVFSGMFDNMTASVPIRIGEPPVKNIHNESPEEDGNDELGPLGMSGNRKRSSRLLVTAPINDEWMEETSIPQEITFEGSISMPRSIARDSSLRLGGLPEVVATRESIKDLAAPAGHSNSISEYDINPSLEGLLEIMLASVNDYEIIETKIGFPTWRNVFSALTPKTFGSIIAHVAIDTDQPRVALLIAREVHGGLYFSCEYVIEALRNTADWNRCTMINYLLPYCTDILVSYHAIKDELSEWELIVTDRDFKEAIRLKSSAIRKE